MHSFIKNTRHTFTPLGQEPYELVNAPIGWDDLKLDLTRSNKTDGIVLDITQNNQFVGVDADYLKKQRNDLGIDGIVEYKIENKTYDTWEVYDIAYIELASLKYDKVTATVDYVDSPVDKIFRKNKNEKFELDRLTDINDNPIPALELKNYRHKSREIFLRTEWKLDNPYTLTETLVHPNPLIIYPLLKIDVQSDVNAQNVISGTNGGVSSIFYYDNDRSKTLDLKLSIEAVSNDNFDSYDLAILRFIVYENGLDLDYKNDFQLQTFTNNEDIVYEGNLQIDLQEGESLALSILISRENGSGQVNNYSFDINKSNLRITEDSLYDPVNPRDSLIDCITVFDGFKRIFQIMLPDVEFKSDFIQNNWNDVPLFSGETARHVTYEDEETEEVTKAPLATLSFDDLFKACFTVMGGIAFGIHQEGGQTIFRLEEIDYFFDNSEGIYLGQLTDIEVEENTDKQYGSIKVGFSKSGENEEVFGLQATHTETIYNLPANSTDTVYDASCELRTDPTELELCFRKQHSSYPDEDTQYDKDVFLVDCKIVNGVYTPFEWQDHFESVTGIYSKNTAYNYRFSPFNCMMRHASNFKQEYHLPVYQEKLVAFKSSKGNKELKTTLTGGIERAENGTIKINELDEAIYTSQTVKGKAAVNLDLVKQIRGGTGKKNYYKRFTYRNEKGQLKSGYMSTMKIDEKLDIELYTAV